MAKLAVFSLFTLCPLLAWGAEAVRYTYEVVNIYPHDSGAFTQGLKYHGGFIYESTGRHGQSRLMRLQLETGEALQSRALPRRYFGEGIEIVGEALYQLTWRSGRVFVYDLQTFKTKGARRIAGEGWGLAFDGASLIISNGSDRLQFLDPSTFAVQRQVQVRLNGAPLARLNELEFIDGEVWANVWQTAEIARIDPADGRVTGLVDLRGLEAQGRYGANRGVLNGIAWDAEGGRLFVTGKNWANLFEIEVVAR